MRAHQGEGQHAPIEVLDSLFGPRHVLPALSIPSESKLPIHEAGDHMGNGPWGRISWKTWHILISAVRSNCCIVDKNRPRSSFRETGFVPVLIQR